jgi:hypothetical protein
LSTRQTILDADQQARAEAIRLEVIGKLPPGFVDEHYGLSVVELSELRRLKAAGAAATDVDTYIALAKGEPVPANRLQQEVVRHQRRRDHD